MHPRPCRPHPYRHRPPFRQFGSAKRFGRSLGAAHGAKDAVPARTTLASLKGSAVVIQKTVEVGEWSVSWTSVSLLARLSKSFGGSPCLVAILPRTCRWLV